MLVNNAGVGAVEPLLMSDVEAMEKMIAINVTALLVSSMPSRRPSSHVRRHDRQHSLRIGRRSRNPQRRLWRDEGVRYRSDVLSAEGAGRKEHPIQAVLPGAVETPFWEASGGSLDRLPDQIVMKAEDAVDAALAGLDMGELITLPSVPNIEDWNAYEAARQKLMPNLSRKLPAPRYRTPALAS